MVAEYLVFSPAIARVRNGTCYSAGECQEFGGVVSGLCAGGYGVCCIFDTGCDGTISKNHTYFSSSGGYNADSCALKICRPDPSVCQIRLDFDSFILNDAESSSEVEIKEPNLSAHGQCLIDNFQVGVPGGVSSPVICGTNSGYHMYLDIGESCNTVVFNFGQGPLITREWTIKVVYISCDEVNRSPGGCLQYFRSPAGVIQSFNYNSNEGKQLAEQSYSVCVRPELGFCSLCLSSGLPDKSLFRVSGQEENLDCEDTQDYLSIPGGLCQDSRYTGDHSRSRSTSIVVDRYCGSTLDCGKLLNTRAEKGGATSRVVGAKQFTVCTKMLPYILHFHTDRFETVVSQSRSSKGFSIEYWQTPC